MPGAERVLVFGASGFFGSWICRKLEEAGFEAVPARSRNGDRADLLEIAAVCESIASVTPAAVVNETHGLMTFDAEGRADWRATPSFHPHRDSARLASESASLPSPEERARMRRLIFGEGSDE